MTRMKALLVSFNFIQVVMYSLSFISFLRGLHVRNGLSKGMVTSHLFDLIFQNALDSVNSMRNMTMEGAKRPRFIEG